MTPGEVERSDLAGDSRGRLVALRVGATRL